MLMASTQRLVGVVIALVALLTASTAWATIIVSGSSPAYNGSDDPWAPASLMVGNAFGAGHLTINGGSAVNSGQCIMLSPPGAGPSTVTVTGAGSTWTNSLPLSFGSSGNATLNILGGGSVTDTAGTITSSSGTGSVTVGGGTGAATWINSGSLTLSSTGTLNINSGGLVSASSLVTGSGSPNLNFGGGALRIIATGSATTAMNLQAGGGTLDVPTVGSTFTPSGLISGVDGLTKTGAGTLQLQRAETYGGATNVSGGTLKLAGSGSVANSPTISVASGAKLDGSGVTAGLNYDGHRFSLAAGQTLKGDGTVVGALGVAAGSEIDPGTSIGTLTTGNLVFAAATSILRPEIDLGAVLRADLLNLTGTITLGGARLDVTLLNTPAVPTTPETFLLIANDGADPVIGTFGAIDVPGFITTIDYAYTGTDVLGRVGDGNDVALTLVAVPEPSGLLLAATALAVCFVVASRNPAP